MSSVPYTKGDTVRIKTGRYRGAPGTIEHIVHRTAEVIGLGPLYIVKLDVGSLVYVRAEIERVESEVGNG